MASKLLNVLNEIEKGRQLLVTKAQNTMFQIPDDADLRSLLPCINNPSIEAPEIIGLDEPDWQHPSEWPDGKTLLNTVGEKSGFQPGVFILLDANKLESTTVLPKKLTSTSKPNGWDSTATYINTGADGYLTSDGVWYSNTSNDITHSWDTTQDIVVTEGLFPGTYRWIILYFGSNTGNKGYNSLRAWPCVEVILKYVGRPDEPNYYSYNYIDVYGPNDQTCRANNKLMDSLINYEVLSGAITSFTCPGWSQTQLQYCPQLRNVTFPLDDPNFNAGYRHYNNYYWIPAEDIRLQKYNVKYNKGLNGATISFTNCVSLREVDLQNTTMTNTVLYFASGNYTHLKKVKAHQACIRMDSYCWMPTPDVCEYDVDGVNDIYYGTPFNWYSNYIPYKSGLSLTAIPYGYGLVSIVNLSTLQFDNINNTSIYRNSTSSIYPNVTRCYLSEIILPDNITVRLNLSKLSLKYSCILDILDKLIDINQLEEEVYNPTIVLGATNLAKLTNEEIAIATDKGWTVV